VPARGGLGTRPAALAGNAQDRTQGAPGKDRRSRDGRSERPARENTTGNSRPPEATQSKTGGSNTNHLHPSLEIARAETGAGNAPARSHGTISKDRLSPDPRRDARAGRPVKNDTPGRSNLDVQEHQARRPTTPVNSRPPPPSSKPVYGSGRTPQEVSTISSTMKELEYHNKSRVTRGGIQTSQTSNKG